MGTRYLIDSNVIIDYLNGILPENGKELLFAVEPIISVITQIEISGYSKLSAVDKVKISELIKSATIYDIDQQIASKTI